MQTRAVLLHNQCRAHVLHRLVPIRQALHALLHNRARLRTDLYVRKYEDVSFSVAKRRCKRRDKRKLTLLWLYVWFASTNSTLSLIILLTSSAMKSAWFVCVVCARVRECECACALSLPDFSASKRKRLRRLHPRVCLRWPRPSKPRYIYHAPPPAVLVPVPRSCLPCQLLPISLPAPSFCIYLDTESAIETFHGRTDGRTCN